MPTSLAHADPGPRITLLREVSDGPIAALFAGSRRTPDAEKLVAVKVLRHRRARDVEQLVKLRAIGRRLDAIGHRNVLASTELAVVDGRPALLSPWIEGIDLLDWVEVLRETDTPVPTRVVCDVLRGAAAALDAALNRTVWGESEPLGLTHRDVKPSNVMVSRDGEVKLADFGTGLTTLGGRDGRVTASKAGLGRYMSPGRRQGKRGGPASDVYALGLIGVELLSGRWLQRVRDENPAHDRHLAEVVAAFGDLGMRAPADERSLRSLLLRMVAFDPDARPPATEVAQTLRTLSDRCPGPSLESFAHDHAHAYGVTDPPVPGAFPDGVVVAADGIEPIAAMLGDPSGDDLGAFDEGFVEGPHKGFGAAAAVAADEEASVFVSASLLDDDDDPLLAPLGPPPTAPPAPIRLRSVHTGPIVVPTVVSVEPAAAPRGVLSLVAAAGFGAVAFAAAAGVALGLAIGLLVAHGW